MEYYERDADGEGPGPSRIVSDASKPSSSKASHPSFIPIVPVSLQPDQNQLREGSSNSGATRQTTATTVINFAKFLLFGSRECVCVCLCRWVHVYVCGVDRCVHGIIGCFIKGHSIKLSKIFVRLFQPRGTVVPIASPESPDSSASGNKMPNDAIPQVEAILTNA